MLGDRARADRGAAARRGVPRALLHGLRAPARLRARARPTASPKTPEWAAAICGVAGGRIRALARRMAATRTHDHRRVVAAARRSTASSRTGRRSRWPRCSARSACPAAASRFGHGSINGVGNPRLDLPAPDAAAGPQPGRRVHPGRARRRHAARSRASAFDFNGARRHYPDIRLVYWAGGNPFHHHQDLNRLRARLAAARDGRSCTSRWWTATARHADIVLPATTTLERNDIGGAPRDRYVVAMKQAIEPVGEARDDYDDLRRPRRARSAASDAFTEGRSEMQWLRASVRQRARALARAPASSCPTSTRSGRRAASSCRRRDEAVRAVRRRSAPTRSAPAATRRPARSSSTPSASRGSATTTARRTRRGSRPTEWLGARSGAALPAAPRDEPAARPPARADRSRAGRAGEQGRGPASRSACIRRTRRSAASPAATSCACSTSAAPASPARDRRRRAPRRRGHGDRRVVRPGRHPGRHEGAGAQRLERHGNPNVLSLDRRHLAPHPGCARAVGAASRSSATRARRPCRRGRPRFRSLRPASVPCGCARGKPLPSARSRPPSAGSRRARRRAASRGKLRGVCRDYSLPYPGRRRASLLHCPGKECVMRVRCEACPSSGSDFVWHRYREVRADTERLAAPLATEDYGCRACPTRARRSGTWRTSRGSSRRSCSRRRARLPPFHPQFGYLFNSYYETVGSFLPRVQRGLLSRPTVDEVYRYRAHVDGAIAVVIDTVGDSAGARSRGASSSASTTSSSTRSCCSWTSSTLRGQPAAPRLPRRAAERRRRTVRAARAGSTRAGGMRRDRSRRAAASPSTTRRRATACCCEPFRSRPAGHQRRVSGVHGRRRLRASPSSGSSDGWATVRRARLGGARSTGSGATASGGT